MGSPLTPEIIARSLLPSDERWQQFDADCPGLVLRANRSTAAYEIRLNRAPPVRRVIAATNEISLETAREITRRAREAHSKKVVIDQAWIGRTLDEVGPGDVPAAPAAPAGPEPVDGAWTVGELYDRYVEHLADGGRSASTVADARKSGALVRSSLADRIAGKITAEDLQEAVDGITHVQPATAKRGAETTRRVWKWASSTENSQRTGVRENVAAGLRLPDPGPRRPRPQPDFFHPLDAFDVAYLIAVCRSGVLPAVVGDSIELICLSGIEPYAVLTARLADVDRYVWTVPKQRMNRAADLEMPAAPFAHVLKSHGHDDWVFPHLRTKRGAVTPHLQFYVVSKVLRQIPHHTQFNAFSIRQALWSWLSKNWEGDLYSETAGLEQIRDIRPGEEISPLDALAHRNSGFSAWRAHLETLIPDAAKAVDKDAIRREVAILRSTR